MNRFQKLLSKLSFPTRKLLGLLPQATWQSVFYEMNPRLIRVFPPPVSLKPIKHEENRQLVAFGTKHQFWLPATCNLSVDLWGEYLSVYWEHIVNRHYYLRYYPMFPKDSVVIDCGAFCGFFTRLALERGAGRVVAIEPNPLMRSCLAATFSEEISKGKVIVENALLAQTVCDLYYEDQPSASFGGAASPNGKSGTIVKGICLDELISRLKLDRFDFLKMDIEGFEIQSLLGASKCLRRFLPHLSVTTYHRCADYQMLRYYLQTLGYTHICPSGLSQRPKDAPSDWRPAMIYAWA